MIQLIKEETGQGLVEYALIIALIATALVATLIAFREKIDKFISNSSDKVGKSLN